MLIVGIVLLLVRFPAFAQTEAPYSRINIGGSISHAGRFEVNDSLTLNQGAVLQTGNRFAITSVKVRGNNGVATAIGEHSVRISWQAAAQGVAGFNVFRSTSINGPFDHYIASVPVPGTQCIDPSVEPGVLYYYMVYADDGSGYTWPWTDSIEFKNDPQLTPTPTETATATSTSTPSPSATPSDTPTSSPTQTSTPTDIPTETWTPTSTATHTPTPSETCTPTATETATFTSTPSETPSPTPSATFTPTPSETSTPTASETPTTKPTLTPTASPTGTSTDTPTMTATPTVDYFSRCDLNGDHEVGPGDLCTLIDALRSLPAAKSGIPCASGDIDGNGVIDANDLYLLSAFWGIHDATTETNLLRERW